MSPNYGVKQVADILGCSTNTVYTYLRENKIKAVRIGNGRFHIPQSEIDRLTGTKKVEATVQINPVIQPQIQEPPKFHSSHAMDIPDFFDWFVGVGSILLGIAFMLFTKILENESIRIYLPWLSPIRISLIASGFGLLLSDFRGKEFVRWHKSFHLILTVTYLALGLVLFIAGNIQGLIIYGSLGFILLANFFMKISGALSFVSYLLLVIIAFGWVLIGLSLSALIILPIGIISFLLWIYKRKSWIFVGILTIFALFIIGFSVYLAWHVYWVSAFFLLFTALMAFILILWESLDFYHKDEKFLVYLLMGLIFGIFTGGLFVIRITQQNVLDFTSRQINDKVGYGKQFVVSKVEEAKKTVERSAKNDNITALLLEKETEDKLESKIRPYLKTIYEGSQSNIRKLIVFDKEGKALASYPIDESINGQDYSFRDYFQETVKGGGVFLSDIFESKSSLSLPVVVATAPIIDGKNNVVGVFLGSVDLNSLGTKLQEITSSDFGEYFMVIDKKGNFIMHPDSKYVMESVGNEGLIKNAVKGLSGIQEGYNYKGVRVMQGYSYIEKYGWLILIQIPMVSILRPTQPALATVYLAIILAMLAVVGIFAFYHKRMKSV